MERHGWAAALAFLAAGVLLAGCSGRARPGAPAPPFRLRAANGQTVSLTSYRGQVLVLNFWASWCPPCISETPSLNQLAADLRGSPVRILAVSIDADPAAYQRFLRSFHVDFTTARQPSAALMHRYGTQKIPETYIVDASGKVVRKIVGEYDWSSPAMVRYLRDLAAGRVAGSVPARPARSAPARAALNRPTTAGA